METAIKTNSNLFLNVCFPSRFSVGGEGPWSPARFQPPMAPQRWRVVWGLSASSQQRQSTLAQLQMQVDTFSNLDTKFL